MTTTIPSKRLITSPATSARASKIMRVNGGIDRTSSDNKVVTSPSTGSTFKTLMGPGLNFAAAAPAPIKTYLPHQREKLQEEMRLIWKQLFDDVKHASQRGREHAALLDANAAFAECKFYPTNVDNMTFCHYVLCYNISNEDYSKLLDLMAHSIVRKMPCSYMEYTLKTLNRQHGCSMRKLIVLKHTKGDIEATCT